MKRIPRSNTPSRGLVQAFSSGRAYLEPDGRWVHAHYDYPQYEHIYLSAGTDDTLRPSWALIGWNVEKGDRIKRFNVQGRVTTPALNGVELAIFTLSGPNGQPVTDANDYVLTQVDRFTIPTPSNVQMLRHQSDVDFEIEHAGTLGVCYRPAVNPTSQQAFSHTIECLIDKKL